MIIWSGFGIVLLIAQLFTSCVGTAVLIVGLSSILGDKLAIFLSSLVGAGIAYYSMNFLRVKFSDKGKVMIDPKTGQPSLYKRQDGVFFIDCKYWQIGVPIVFIGYAVVSFFTS